MNAARMSRDLLGLIAWLVLCYAVAALGALASVDAVDFYAQLVRPDWAPAASVFGPVWTVLYALMAVAAWLVWRSYRFSGAPVALVLFLVQLAANGLWSWVFFKWHAGAYATANVLVLWLLLFATVVAFWRKRRWSGVLLVPYLLWVTFASLLTYSVWRLNPELLGGNAIAA